MRITNKVQVKQREYNINENKNTGDDSKNNAINEGDKICQSQKSSHETSKSFDDLWNSGKSKNMISNDRQDSQCFNPPADNIKFALLYLVFLFSFIGSVFLVSYHYWLLSFFVALSIIIFVISAIKPDRQACLDPLAPTFWVCLYLVILWILSFTAETISRRFGAFLS